MRLAASFVTNIIQWAQNCIQTYLNIHFELRRGQRDDHIIKILTIYEKPSEERRSNKTCALATPMHAIHIQ